MKRVAAFLNKLSPDTTVLLWLGIWFLINVIQGTFTELVDDEAYYHIYAQSLDWGYFDHPPFLAILIWLGETIFGTTEIGVRFFVIALQPLYLWIFWRTICPTNATRKDATLYMLISSAIIMMQPYGFVAVPDAPLLLGTALFFAAYKAFLENRKLSWLWLGIAMAVMAYSKYQGALVVLFAILFNPKLLINFRFYASGAVALALFTPHLLWQYNNDWPSFMYHLSDRNRPFAWSSVTEYILNLIAVFSPFFIPLWVQAYRKVKAQNLFERALKWTPISFFIFFLLSSARGSTQPQWLIVATFGLVWILFFYLREHERSRKYAVRMALFTLALISILRIEMIFNIFGLSQKLKVSGNREKYGAIEQIANGRPVIFKGSYATASKYIFYTKGEGYCTPALGYRTHQWQYIDDSKFLGKEVIVEYSPTEEEINLLPDKYFSSTLPSGNVFKYYIEKSYLPLKMVKITTNEPLPSSITKGKEIKLKLTIDNSYNYNIVTSNKVRFLMQLRALNIAQTYNIANGVEIPANSTIEYNGNFTLPTNIPSGIYQIGFALVNDGMDGWFSSVPQSVELQ